jgi:hypothetical protein
LPRGNLSGGGTARSGNMWRQSPSTSRCLLLWRPHPLQGCSPSLAVASRPIPAEAAVHRWLSASTPSSARLQPRASYQNSARLQAIVGCEYVPPRSFNDAHGGGPRLPALARTVRRTTRRYTALLVACVRTACGVHVYRGTPAAMQGAPLALRATPPSHMHRRIAISDPSERRLAEPRRVSARAPDPVGLHGCSASWLCRCLSTYVHVRTRAVEWMPSGPVTTAAPCRSCTCGLHSHMTLHTHPHHTAAAADARHFVLHIRSWSFVVRRALGN